MNETGNNKDTQERSTNEYASLRIPVFVKLGKQVNDNLIPRKRLSKSAAQRYTPVTDSCVRDVRFYVSLLFDLCSADLFQAEASSNRTTRF